MAASHSGDLAALLKPFGSLITKREDNKGDDKI
jgi:hypothetical protein